MAPRPPLVPRIDNPELLSAVAALTRAADLIRSVMVQAAEDEPSMMKVMIEHQEVLLRADAVIDEFVEYMKVNGPRHEE